MENKIAVIEGIGYLCMRLANKYFVGRTIWIAVFLDVIAKLITAAAEGILPLFFNTQYVLMRFSIVNLDSYSTIVSILP